MRLIGMALIVVLAAGLWWAVIKYVEAEEGPVVTIDEVKLVSLTGSALLSDESS